MNTSSSGEMENFEQAHAQALIRNRTSFSLAKDFLNDTKVLFSMSPTGSLDPDTPPNPGSHMEMPQQCGMSGVIHLS